MTWRLLEGVCTVNVGSFLFSLQLIKQHLTDASHPSEAAFFILQSAAHTAPRARLAAGTTETAYTTKERQSFQPCRFSLKLMIDSGLFHYRICCMTRFNSCINSHISFGNRTIPNVVISFSSANKTAPVVL